MQIAYTLTFADYREANRALLAARLRGRRRLMGALLAMVAAAVGVLSSNYLTSVAPDTDAHKLLHGSAEGIPFLLILCAILAGTLITMRGARGKLGNFAIRRAPPPAAGWRLGFAGVIFVGAFVSLSMMDQQPDAKTVFASDWAAAIAPRLPWILLFIALFTYVFLMNRGAVEAAWLGNPILHRRCETEITAERIVVSTPVSKQDISWDAFVAWGQTPNLYVLCVSTTTYLIIPKRAFADESQGAAFSNILNHTIVPAP